MFVDQYERSLDSKFRIVLPKRFREMLGYRVYLARSDSSLAVYSEEQFAETSQRLIDLDRAGELPRQVRLAFAASTVAVEPDPKTGRITIPPQVARVRQPDQRRDRGGCSHTCRDLGQGDVRSARGGAHRRRATTIQSWRSNQLSERT